ncbi:HET-domain-containing protein [Hyaloscypha hepaticicola]|uniref:HET-domain-containing protein n=1 Tax=Hyaloscypha hepaticicola TaxID=2082293 RepID=A0A2J6PD67_9HELO|nr:HET-domain-containing protein [Hyaloscypha hepaticicola]
MSYLAQSNQTAGICIYCDLPKTTYETGFWAGNLDCLASAAQNGCLRCSFLAKCITCFAPGTFNERNRFRVWPCFRLCELTINRDEFVLDIFSIPGGVSTLYQGIPVKSLLPGETSSDKTFRTIANWINDCTRNHIGCNPTVPTSVDYSQLPKRILELTGGRITLREYPSERPLYACLSHCWGTSDRIIKTSLTNFDEFKNEVLWNNLTENFKHAVDICRRLDIGFLWIDSLCIIQDSENDWKEESAKMASIYENAFLTIAATKSKEGAGGCYATTSPEFLGISVPNTDIYVRRHCPEFPTHWIHKDPERWPLLSRGWVYQEMRLSRRVLHFCSQEVIWECRESRKSESGCSDKDLSTDKPYYKDTMDAAVPYWKLEEDPRKLWYRTVHEYSRMQLTFEKDKFPALAALTQKMETLRGDDRFLAGLWEKTLLLDLLWMVWPSPVTGRSATWRAPTWSWASVQSQVMWESSVDSVLSSVQVVDIHYTTEGPTHMGEIREAAIILRAPVIRARIENNRPCLDPTITSLGEIAIINEKIDYLFSMRGKYHVSSGTKVSIIPIGISMRNHRYTGIVLITRDGTLLHERIGYVELAHHNTRGILEGDIKAGKGTEEANINYVNSILTNLPLSNITIV